MFLSFSLDALAFGQRISIEISKIILRDKKKIRTFVVPTIDGVSRETIKASHPK